MRQSPVQSSAGVRRVLKRCSSAQGSSRARGRAEPSNAFSGCCAATHSSTAILSLRSSAVQCSAGHIVESER